MRDRKNEISSLRLKVMGFHQNAKGNTVKHPYTLTNAVVTGIFDQYLESYTDFETSIIELPEAISKQFQKIGVQQVTKITENELDIFQFALGYIYRDKESIPTVDLHNGYERDEITLEGEKYQYQHLYFSIIPSEQSIVADTKCYNGTIKHFINDIFANLLNAGDYQVNADELLTSVRVHIKGVLDGDYKSILRSQFQNMKKFEMTLASPNQAYMDAQDDEQVIDSPFDIVMGAVGAMVGEDVTANESPFTSIRVEFNFKETPHGQANIFRGFKREVKNKLLEINDDSLVRSSSISYRDTTQNEVLRAIKRGITLSQQVELPANEYTNIAQMLEVQKDFFIDYKTGQL